MRGAPNQLAYTPLEAIAIGRPVDRVSYIIDACRNRTVLDLGAMDETAFALKQGTGSWLHEEIAGVAARVVGLDASAALPEGGLATGANSVIYRGNIFALAEFVDRLALDPDIVVAGELIEHMENPSEFLRSIRNVQRLRGRKLLLSTPNATAIHNVMIGLTKRESTHHDHLCILSFKTLTTLLSRAGYQEWQITPYHADFAEMRGRNAGLRRRIVTAGQAAVGLAERLFPMLSFGYIVETVI